MEKKEENNKPKNDYLKYLGLFTQLGINLAVCILVGFLIGRYLDGVFYTSPILLIVFSFLGGAAAIKVLFDMSKKF